jgi:hypothetical protein
LTKLGFIRKLRPKWFHKIDPRVLRFDVENQVVENQVVENKVVENKAVEATYC